MSKVLLVSGGRTWTDESRLRDVLKVMRRNGFDVLRHGACRGLDRMAGTIGAELGFEIDPMPADWDTHGKAAGVIRNQAMLDKEPTPKALAAFHNDLDSSKGTKDMIERARRRKLATLLCTSSDCRWVK